MKNLWFPKAFIIFLLILFCLGSSFSQEKENEEDIDIDSLEVPVIKSLSFKEHDEVLSALDSAIEENDKLAFRNRKTNPSFYIYVPTGKDTIFSVSAATGVPYDTISTLNSIPSAETSVLGKNIVLTDVKGLFVPEKPSTSVEIFLCKTYESRFEDAPVFFLSGKKFYFFEGERFSPYHRLFFIDSNFSLPLDKRIITSAFGFRESPVYGTWKKHNGIDFRAAEGDNVYSCKAGMVSLVKENDEVFGNYIIVTHSESLTSVYAHLSKILVKEGDAVRGGEKIALSGQTGMVTGPHLHFEIRRNGKAVDPDKILPKAPSAR